MARSNHSDTWLLAFVRIPCPSILATKTIEQLFIFSQEDCIYTLLPHVAGAEASMMMIFKLSVSNDASKYRCLVLLHMISSMSIKDRLLGKPYFCPKMLFLKM